MFETKIIAYGSSAYDRALALRDRVLRAPLGLKFDADFLAIEKNPEHAHLAVLRGEDVVGVLIMTDVGGGQVKMRQVAVDDSVQGQGVGRLLVEFSEKWARERGFEEIVLNARETAAPFYTRLAYETVSDTFTEVGIPHRKMRKIL